MLLDHIASLRLGNVTTIECYQFNIEHALDIEAADLALFIDAGVGTPGPFTFGEIVAGDTLSHSTHALEPAAVLATYRKITGRSHPAAFGLCVRGEYFDLGAPLSLEGAANLEHAAAFVVDYLTRLQCR